MATSPSDSVTSDDEVAAVLVAVRLFLDTETEETAATRAENLWGKAGRSETMWGDRHRRWRPLR